MSTPKLNALPDEQVSGSQTCFGSGSDLALVQAENLQEPQTANQPPGEPSRTQTTTKDWLNLVEAAAYLGRSKQTLYNWINLGTGPRRKKEYGRWYFNRKDLDAHRKANTQTFEAFR